MITHLLFFGSTLLTAFKKRKRTNLAVAFILLFVFAALRYNFGNDYPAYFENFLKVKAGLSVYGDQVLFEWLNRYSPSYYFLIAVTSLFTIYTFYWLIRNYVSEKCWPMAMLILLINPYLFLMSLSAIRQTISMCLFIFSIHFAYKRKPIPYFLLIAAASLFHTSALLLLPVYFIANEKKFSKTFSAVTVFATVLLLVSSSLFSNIIESMLSAIDVSNYWYYYKQDEGNSLRATLLSAVYFIYVVINLPYLKGKTLMFSKLYLLAAICALLSYKVSMITRVQQYFDIFSIVSLPMIMEANLERCKGLRLMNVLNRYIFPLLILAIYVLRYYSFFTNPLWEPFTEYHTIFEVL